MKKKEITWREAQKKVDEIHEVLLATHPGFNDAVQIIHFEGTVLFYESAFYLVYHNYYLIFTEHHGSFMYDKDDLRSVRQFKYVDDEVKLTPKLEKELKDEWNLYKTEPDKWHEMIEASRSDRVKEINKKLGLPKKEDVQANKTLAALNDLVFQRDEILAKVDAKKKKKKKQ